MSSWTTTATKAEQQKSESAEEMEATKKQQLEITSHATGKLIYYAPCWGFYIIFLDFASAYVSPFFIDKVSRV